MRGITLLSAAVILTLCAPSAFGTTWFITPDGTGDAPTIQAGIDSAAVGDTVLVACGTYFEHGIVMRSGIVLRSESGESGCAYIAAGGNGTVLSFYSVDETAIVEGLHLVGGAASHGGGVYCESSSPTFLECHIHSNMATLCGGGVCCEDHSSPTFQNCLFADNYAQLYAGGVRCTEWSSPLFDGCVFENNMSDLGGGAFSAFERCSPEFVGCVFEGNQSESGGAVAFSSYCSPDFHECVFRANTASSGGAINIRSDGGADIVACLLDENHADGAGGAVYCMSTDVTMAHCTVTGNTADYEGGGLLIRSCSPTVTNCTFYGNLAYAGSGSAIRAFNNGSAHLYNTVLAFGTGGCATDCDYIYLTCCDIYGNEGGDWTEDIEDQLGVDGNIWLDPLFCDPSGEVFDLHEDSPCAPFTEPNDECDLIGAWPVGCGSTPARPATWGMIKALFH